MKNLLPFLLIWVLGFQSIKSQTLVSEWVTCNSQGCKLIDPYYTEGVTFQWSGNCVAGKAEGYGVADKYEKGKLHSRYEGNYSKGIRQGKAKFSNYDKIRPNSLEVWQGEFKNGQFCGYGTYESSDGQKHQGQYINYKKHGLGVVYFPSGEKFEGFFVSDRMYTGKYTNLNGKTTFLQAYYPVNKIKEEKSNYKPRIGVRVTEYFNEEWNRCSQKEAVYYRLVTYEADNKPVGIVKDFYITGQLQSEFTAVYLDYDDEGKNFYEGEATWYFKNGRVQEKRYYYNNHRNGKNTLYYDNGQISQVANYDYGTLDGVYMLWHKTGKPKLMALYESGELSENKYIEYDETGLGALVFREDFKGNEKEWVAKSSGNESELTSDGKLLLTLKNNTSTARFNYITLDQSSNYSIESIIQKKTGKGIEGYGILFGLKDWNNYFRFLISEQGSFVILGEFEGVNIKICDWTSSNAILKGNKRNLLKIMKFDDEFIFSINGEVVKRSPAKNLRGNNFGIIASGTGEFTLENIIVKEFMTADELAKKAPKINNNKTDSWQGNGTGFFISKTGHIATNYHVIEDAKDIQVEFFQKGVKKIYKAKVVASDKQNDLAIIQVQDPKFKFLTPIPYVFSPQIKDVGSDVFALGYPMEDVMGGEIKFTDGKISSKTGIRGDITVYQISVPIQPGNSGGPLFDSKGNLVGITSARLNKEYFDTENVNYAIKASYLKNLIQVLPQPIMLPDYTEIYSKPLTEKIKILSDFIPLIRVK